MRKSILLLKLSILASVLFLWTNASAQGITEVESITCPGNTDGQLSFTATVGSNNTYLWSTGATSQTIKKLPQGLYTLTVTDAGSGNDAGFYTYNLQEPQAITITPIPTNNTTWGATPANCNGTLQTNITGGTGIITYSVYDITARDTLSSILNPIPNLAPGDYIITATDENGCSATQTATIIDANESLLTKMPADTTYACYKMMSGATVKPSNEDIFPVSASFYDANQNLILTVSADYYVLDTNAVLGTPYAPHYIDSIGYWEIPVSSNNVNDTILLLSRNPISSPSGYPNSDYLFVDAQTLVDSVDVLQPDSTFIKREVARNSFTTKPSSLASGELEPGFYMAYYWSSETPLAKGARSGWDIVAPENPVTINYTQTNIKCFGGNTGSIVANAQGSWHDYGVPFQSITIAGATTTGSPNTVTASNLTAGSYNITATDIHGCSRTQTVDIIEPDDSLYIAHDVTKKAKCPYSFDGSIVIRRVIGGQAPFSYEWDGSTATSSETADFLNAGMHKIKITDSNGCTVSDSINIEFTNKSCFYNIVTPNGDGYNDYFDLSDMCYGLQMEAKIFNEAGYLIATLDETNPKWDANDTSTPPTGTASTYTAFVKLYKDGVLITELGESFSVVFTK